MLKISFTVLSNVRYKSSNARLFRLYKRLYLFQCYFSSIFKGNKNCVNGCYISLNSNYRGQKVVLMRSPFHYKTSKTLLSQPKQEVTLVFSVNSNFNDPLFFNDNFIRFTKSANNLSTLVFKKIKISHEILC